MDEKFLEMAGKLAEGEVNAGVIQARNSIPTRPAGFDGYCVADCGTEIPPERLATGAVTCIYCQRLRERNSTFSRRY